MSELPNIDRCPKCKRTDFFTRLRTNERVCKKCGHIWSIARGD